MNTRVIPAANVNDAFVTGIWHLKLNGIAESSRNGPVLVAPGPVITEYQYPQERVLFNPRRDANPVFHLMEAIWMLGGGKSADVLLPFNARMAVYAENNGDIHGAYGDRWVNHFGFDQVQDVIKVLVKDPASRQAVLTMWDPTVDLGAKKRDIPCNTQVYFDLRGDKLNMTVCCRSNDILWGAYGANVVHFSFLQEYIAAVLGVGMGVYRQMSNNFHMYTDLTMAQQFLAMPDTRAPHNHYVTGRATTCPLHYSGESIHALNMDIRDFFEHDYRPRTSFFVSVAHPLRRAYLQRKKGCWYTTSDIADCDWKVAFEEWAARREGKEAENE